MRTRKLFCPHIGARKHKRGKLTENTAGYPVPIAAAHFILPQIRAYHHRQSLVYARVYHIVKCAYRKLIRHLGAEIVDHKQIAPVIPLRFLPGFLTG